MVTRWGMGIDPESKENGISGPWLPLVPGRRAGGHAANGCPARATRAIRAILDGAYAQACATLIEHMDVLRRIAAYLVEHERIDGETFDALYTGDGTVVDSSADWRPETARPRPWADMRGFVDRRRRVAAASPTAGDLGPQPARPRVEPAPANEPTLVPVPIAAVELPTPGPAARIPARRGRGFFGSLRRGPAAAGARSGQSDPERDGSGRHADDGSGRDAGPGGSDRDGRDPGRPAEATTARRHRRIPPAGGHLAPADRGRRRPALIGLVLHRPRAAR